MDQVNTYMQKIIEMIIEFAPTFLLAIAVVVIGFWIAKKMVTLLEKALVKANLSQDIVPFICSMANVLLKVIILLSAAGIVGIETASLVAVLAAAGFAVGMALQGSLGNFAAGIIVLIFKPYKVGDWIEVAEKFGQVEEIQIFSTIIGTPGRKTLIIPNGQVIEDVVTNFSKKGFIRIELNVSMPYAESFPKVRTIILDAIKDVPNVMKEPTPEVGIETYDSHNIILTVRPYTQPDHYWQVTFDAYEAIKAAFNENNVQVAYSEGIELGKIGQ